MAAATPRRRGLLLQEGHLALRPPRVSPLLLLRDDHRFTGALYKEKKNNEQTGAGDSVEDKPKLEQFLVQYEKAVQVKQTASKPNPTLSPNPNPSLTLTLA